MWGLMRENENLSEDYAENNQFSQGIMPYDHELEFIALEEDKRTIPESLVKLYGKSYVDAVRQKETSAPMRPDRCESFKPEMNAGEQTVSKKRDSRRKPKVQHVEPAISKILRRESPRFCSEDRSLMKHHNFNELAERYALSNECEDMITKMDRFYKTRLPYTQYLH